MSPSDIEVLIHYHCCADEHERIEAPAVRDGISWMLDMGLLKPRVDRGRYSSSYETTERGKALVDAWCSQLLPVQVWVIPGREAA
jgi:hypothetical protein